MRIFISVIVLMLLVHVAPAETVFVEAESFASSTDGWRIANNRQTRAASRLATLHGAAGDPRGIASKQIAVPKPGSYRVWVRYLNHESFRGAFRLAVVEDGKSVAAKDFDTQPMPDAKSWEYVWDHVDIDLSAATVELELSKFKNKNCSGYVRHIDCVLLTTDKTLIPNHMPYGPQTFLRVKLGDDYDEPVYVHVFADHYRSPWYQHFHLSKAGANPGLRPENNDRMLGDEPTGQPSEFMARDEAYQAAFRAWLKKQGKSPAELLVSSWDAVKPVPESQREKYPALHYFTQRFRTRALGDFMATQRDILEQAYGRPLPTLVNFSDGATYHANFYGQGVDYFELLDADNQNAIWSEDWDNGASSYQCGAYNVDLMRAAAREAKRSDTTSLPMPDENPGTSN